MAKKKVNSAKKVTEKAVEASKEPISVQKEQQEVEKEPKAPEEYVVKTEREKMAEFLNNPFNRVKVEQDAARLYMMVTGETDLQKCDEKVITEMDVCKKTTLSHKKANNLFNLFQMFGVIEFIEPRKFKFIFNNERKMETILMGIGATLNIVKTDIMRFTAILESKKIGENKEEIPEFTEEQIKAYKTRLHSMVEYALK